MLQLLIMPDILPTWPLVIFIEDDYVPELAQQALDACQGFDESYLQAIITRVASDAEVGLSTN